MNIDQYRALKAQEAQKASATPAPTQVQPQATPQPTPTPVKEEPKPTETPVIPDKITIEGIGEVAIDELKNGYLRQSDYTKKTQEVAKQRQEAEEALKLAESIKQNPQLVEQIKQTTQVPPSLDPTTRTIVELQNMVYDMKLEKEISDLQHKYTDFEVREVLAVAKAKHLTNLEDAYLINKAQKFTSTPQPQVVQVDEAKLRAKILAEIQAEKDATQTIISTDATPIVTDNRPALSNAEMKVASRMFKSAKDPYAEYIKWRDMGKKK